MEPTETERLSEALVDLEVRVAFQSRALAELDDVVRTMFARVEALEKELDELRRGAAAAPAIGPANEPPPHY